MTEIIFSFIAGLVLFLFAVKKLAETLQMTLGEKVNKPIKRFTSNTISSSLIGTMVTALLDTSSAVINITIVFVNSKILTLRQAMKIYEILTTDYRFYIN